MKNRFALHDLMRDIDLLEILRGGGLFLVIKILATVGAYLFTYYISREYGPEGNGIIAFVLTLSVLLAALYNLGLNTYAVKIIPYFKHQKNDQGAWVFYINSLLTILGMTTAGSLILSGMGYLLFTDSLAQELNLVSILVFPLSFLLFISHIFKAQKNILVFSFLQNNIAQGLALLLLLIPVWGYASPIQPAYALTLAVLILAAIGFLLYKPVKGPTFQSSTVKYSLILRDAVPMMAGGLAFMVLNLSDRLMLRFLDTTPELGIYDVVLRLTNLSLIAILSLNAIAEPKFSELHAAHALRRLKKMAQKVTFTGIILSLPIIILLAFFPRFFLGLFGTHGEFLTGTSTLYILLAGQLINVLCGAVLVLLNMTGHQRNVQRILITAALINIGLNFILIPLFGIDGAAVATTVTTFIWNLWALWIVHKKLGFWMLSRK